MSDDLIAQAEALIKPMQCFTESWLVEAEKVLPELVEEVKRWREIAIEAKAEAIYNLELRDTIREHPTDSHHMPMYRDFAGKSECRTEAANELGIQISQDTAYVTRLEAAYSDTIEGLTGDPLAAKEALEKIQHED